MIPMLCESHQQLLAEIGFDPDQRRRLADALAHLENCEQCRAAVAESDRLAAVLGSGGGDEEIPSAGWENFENKLTDTVARASTGGRPRKWTRFTLALAASLLIGSVGLIAGLSAWFRASPVAPGNETVAHLTDAEISQRTRAFTEINHVFDGRTGWVLISGAQSDMGLLPKGAAEDQRPLLVRLDLSRQGQFVCKADVMIVAGQTADVTLPTGSGSLRCSLGTSAADAAILTLRAEVRAEAKQELEALLSTTIRLKGKHPIPVGQLVTPSGVYDLKVLFALPGKGAQSL
jgi:hypothetical protein